MALASANDGAPLMLGPMSTIEETAARFAIAAHGEQKRKYTGEPYWKHCGAVATLVKTVNHTGVQLAAAWLHDTLEDTATTYQMLLDAFGLPVAEMVVYLTDTPVSKGNRATRNIVDRARLATVPAAAKTVKLADLIDNSTTIVQYDPNFARIYIAEKRLLLDESLRDGDAALWWAADQIVRDAQEKLGVRKA